MTQITAFLQIVIAVALLNVWILRFSKATKYRGGQAKNLKEEFKSYGLPDWFIYLIGFLKISSAIALVVGFWRPQVILPAAFVVAVLMVGALSMHFKVKDAAIKYLPAALMLLMSSLLILVLVS